MNLKIPQMAMMLTMMGMVPCEVMYDALWPLLPV
jgi:hypothetical protein